MRSIRVLAKNMGDPYHEPTIVVHDKTHLKTMGGKYKLQKKFYVSFYCLTGG